MAGDQYDVDHMDAVNLETVHRNGTAHVDSSIDPESPEHRTTFDMQACEQAGPSDDLFEQSHKD